jgi:hypothetical protein
MNRYPSREAYAYAKNALNAINKIIVPNLRLGPSVNAQAIKTLNALNRISAFSAKLNISAVVGVLCRKTAINRISAFFAFSAYAYGPLIHRGS